MTMAKKRHNPLGDTWVVTDAVQRINPRTRGSNPGKVYVYEIHAQSGGVYGHATSKTAAARWQKAHTVAGRLMPYRLKRVAVTPEFRDQLLAKERAEGLVTNPSLTDYVRAGRRAVASSTAAALAAAKRAAEQEALARRPDELSPADAVRLLARAHGVKTNPYAGPLTITHEGPDLIIRHHNPVNSVRGLYEVLKDGLTPVWSGKASSPDGAMRKFRKETGIGYPHGALFDGNYSVRRVRGARKNPSDIQVAKGWKVVRNGPAGVRATSPLGDVVFGSYRGRAQGFSWSAKVPRNVKRAAYVIMESP